MMTQDGFITKLIGEIIIVLAALWLCATYVWAEEPVVERPVLRPVEVVPVEIIRPAEPHRQPQERPHPQPERPHEPIDPEYGRDWPEPPVEPDHGGDHPDQPGHDQPDSEHPERPEHEPGEHDRPWEHEPERRPEWEMQERPEHPEMPEDLDLQPVPDVPEPQDPRVFADTLKPDLTCSTPAVNGIITGDVNPLKVTVTNVGKAPTAKPFRVEIQVIGNAAAGHFGQTWVTQPLAAGQAIKVDITMMHSTAADPKYRVMVDAATTIDESDETNNYSTPFKHVPVKIISPGEVNIVGILKFKVHNKHLCPGQRPRITAEVAGKDIAWLIVYAHQTPAAGPQHMERRFADMGLEGFAERTWLLPIPAWPTGHQPLPGDTMRIAIGIKDKKTMKVLDLKHVDVPIARAPATLGIDKVSYTWNKAQQRVTDVQVHLNAGGTQPFNIGDFGAADAGSISVLCTIKRRMPAKHPKYGHDHAASEFIHNKLYDVNGKGPLAVKYPGGPGLATHTPTYGPVKFPVSVAIDSADKVAGVVKHIYYGSPDGDPDAVYTYPPYLYVFVRAQTAKGSVMLNAWVEIKEAPKTVWNESVCKGMIIQSGGDGPYEN